MLYVERSNRTEKLLEGLATRLASPRPDPLSPCLVVVQGQGMERWIAQRVADEHDVCANVDFLFPRNLIEGVFGHAEGDPGFEKAGVEASLAANSRWEVDSLVWAVARRLHLDRNADRLAPLARQLESSDGDWRLIQLAQQIALRFDDYITYRPDWVARWAASDPASESAVLGPNEAWQAWLFQRVLEDLGPGHLADRAARFLSLIESADLDALGKSLRSAYPNGIEVFAVSTLPPLYLSVLDGLAQILDVRLSVLSPSRHYWADLWSEIRAEEEDIASAQGELALYDEPPSTSGLENSAASLLAGLGRLGSDFQSALEEVSGYVEVEPDLFEAPDVADPEAGSPGVPLLRRLQASLLELDSEASPVRGDPIPLADRSIQVHLCHGPKRELEAVESALRVAFDRDPTLTPEDVIVMAPDIDSRVPLIDAVFGGGATDQEANAIPYRIADRGTLRRSPVAEAFAALLGLLSGRAGRSEVLDWLSFEPARTRLGLDSDGVERLGDWAVEAGIRFGLDESHRESLGLDACRRHTWAGGIDRLVLGHAMGASDEIAMSLSPVPLDPFSDPALLGAIGELETALSNARAELGRPRSVREWGHWLTAILEATLDHRDDNAHEHGLLRAAIQKLADSAEAVEFDVAIPFEAMRERFGRNIESSSPAQGFLSGGVTFCELVPLRAIPFRVVVIVGLSDLEFPRRRPAASDDLMGLHPRRGDRNSRVDDRYLFLEALLSARDELILTVPSRDLRDGEDLPPSVVISELLDALDAGFELDPLAPNPDPNRRIRDHIVVDHPIHPFSARYFEADGDARLVGLDREAFEGAQTRRSAIESGGGRERKFLEGLDSGATDGEQPSEPVLRLDELTQRVLRSTRVFARERMGLRLPRPERAIGDFDPVEFDALDQFGLGAALLADRQAGASDDALRERLEASARLPDGEPGRIASRLLRREVSTLFEITSEHFGSESLTERPFDLSFDSVPSLGRARLSGVVRNLSSQGVVRVDFGRFGRRAELETWIQHLVVCALVDEGADLVAQSAIVSRAESSKGGNRVAVFSRVPNAKTELALLFSWAWTVASAPLPFFPKASRAFAEKQVKDQAEQAWRDAHQAFYGGDATAFGFPEFEEELESVRVWEGSRPLESNGADSSGLEFDSLAQRFFEPFFEAREVFER